MIDAMKALLQRKTIVLVEIFHQPAYFSWQKQMEVVLAYLKHIISLF